MIGSDRNAATTAGRKTIADKGQRAGCVREAVGSINGALCCPV
jgi:hypothetical protein